MAVRCIIRCPAVMFAISRIDNVIGRIIRLVSSIITMNGDIAMGELFGTRWLMSLMGFLIMDAMRIDRNIEHDSGNTMDIMEFIVNEYGVIEIRFRKQLARSVFTIS